MKIAIEARSMDNNVPHTGIPRYIVSLLVQLSKIDKDNDYLLISDAPLQHELLDNIGSNFKSVYTNKFMNKGWKVLMYEHYIHTILNEYNPDVFWAPAVVTVSTPKNMKHVYNIHDLIRLELKDENNKYVYAFKQRIFFDFFLKKGLKYSTDLIFLTYDVMNKVNHNYKIENKKEHIIYPSVDFKDQKIDYSKIDPRILSLINNNDKYLFFIGTKETRKGIFVMLDLAIRMKKYNIPYKIVLAGLDGYGFDDFYNEAKKYDNIIDFKHISEEDKIALYENCTAVLYPSLSEGFGIPLLEGTFYKKPVIASDLTVFREVIGDAYYSFKTNNGESLFNTILSFYNSINQNKYIDTNILNKYRIENEAVKLYNILTKI